MFSSLVVFVIMRAVRCLFKVLVAFESGRRKFEVRRKIEC